MTSKKERLEKLNKETIEQTPTRKKYIKKLKVKDIKSEKEAKKVLSTITKDYQKVDIDFITMSIIAEKVWIRSLDLPRFKDKELINVIEAGNELRWASVVSGDRKKEGKEFIQMVKEMLRNKKSN